MEVLTVLVLLLIQLLVLNHLAQLPVPGIHSEIGLNVPLLAEMEF